MKISEQKLRTIIRKTLSESSERRPWRDVTGDSSLPKAYRSGYFDGFGTTFADGKPRFGMNSGYQNKLVDDPDYRKGFEDSSGLVAAEEAEKWHEARRIAAEKKAAADKKAEEEWAKRNELLRSRKKSRDLSDSEQDRLKSEYEADKDNTERYVRISTPDMTDAMYGRGRGRGSSASTILDKKENTLLSWTKYSGSGGSLGT